MIFIDYDNLLPTQKITGILDVVTKTLFQMPFDKVTTRAVCDVRVYGGWYEGATITRLAQDVTIEIQRDFPAIIRLPIGSAINCTFSLNAELAVALIQEPGYHLFNTFRRKGKPSNVKVERPIDIGCTDKGCLLPLMKKLLKTGNCPKPGCKVTVGDLIYRHEQKIVDNMLSCDLIYASDNGMDYIALISGDDDFIPSIRTVLLKGTAIARFYPKPQYQRASFPKGGAVLFERNL